MIRPPQTGRGRFAFVIAAFAFALACGALTTWWAYRPA